jgi:hypothetical protein
VAIKRDADRLFLGVAPLFSQPAVDAYQDFLQRCFSTHTTWGADARLTGKRWNVQYVEGLRVERRAM